MYLYLSLNNLYKLEIKYFIRFDIRMLNEYIFDSVWPFSPKLRMGGNYWLLNVG